MNDRRPTAVIFDLDGTLIDSLPGIEYSAKAAFAACGIAYPEVNLRSLIGPPIRTILSQMAKTTAPEVLRDLENAFRFSYDAEGWRRSYCYPGTEAALSTLHDYGIRIFVVTNKPRHISTRILEMRGIEHLLERIITRDSRTPEYADKKETLGAVLDACALVPSECLFVGDTDEDALAAAAYVMRFAYVSHGYGTICENDARPVHLRLSGFSQLPQVIGLEFAHDR
jgi:phosphoglycolate phosphatase